MDTASATYDEGWFYLVTTAIEAAGGEIPWLFYQCQMLHMHPNKSVITEADLNAISECLVATKKKITIINGLMKRMYEKNEPQVFYDKVRPFLTGWENTPYLPEGLKYGNEEEPRFYAGGSAAQSSLIQILDVFLGVRHDVKNTMISVSSSKSSSFENIVQKLEQVESGSQIPASAEKLKQLKGNNNTNDASSDAVSFQAQQEKNAPHGGKPSMSFQEKMRSHMPGSHRQFLYDMAALPNMNDFIHSDPRITLKGESPAYSNLLEKFYDCVDELRLFRDKHIQMVSVYILVQSKKSVRGTGGTSIIPFLKQSRDDTKKLLPN